MLNKQVLITHPWLWIAEGHTFRKWSQCIIVTRYHKTENKYQFHNDIKMWDWVFCNVISWKWGQQLAVSSRLHSSTSHKTRIILNTLMDASVTRQGFCRLRQTITKSWGSKSYTPQCTPPPPKRNLIILSKLAVNYYSLRLSTVRGSHLTIRHVATSTLTSMWPAH
jgi:hypothetical protein